MELLLGLRFQLDYRRFLLEASDVCVGTLEPAQIDDPKSHTFLPKVVAAARECGVPISLLPICEDNADFYCLTGSGQVQFWSHNGKDDKEWQSLGDWIEDVWLGERS